MSTTPNGIPKFALTDSADIASKMNAQADAIDGLITTRSFPIAVRKMARTSTNTLLTHPFAMTGVVSYDAGTKTNVGDIGFSGGLLTPASPGTYRWGATVQFPAAAAAGVRGTVLLLQNGAEVEDGRSDVPLLSGTTVSITITAGGLVVCGGGDTLQVGLFITGAADLTISPLFFTLERAC